MALQRNNGSPMGYGQPKRSMRRAMLRPEDEEAVGLAPDEGEMRLAPQEEAPSVYPAQPRMPRGPHRLEDQGVSTGVTGPVRSPYQRGPVEATRLNPQSQQGPQGNSGYRQPSTQGGGQGGPLVPGTPAYQQSQAETKRLFSTPMDLDGPRGRPGYIDQVTGQFNSYGPGHVDPRYVRDPNGELPAPQVGIPGLAQGDPSRGALAQYGTGNIPGASGLTTGNFMDQLEGFNTNAWGGNAPEGYEADSIKNSFGKIASRYDVKQPGATRSLMADPEFQQLFPMAKLVEHPNGDMIDFGDGQPVDVIRGAVAGGSGAAWQWGAGGPQQAQSGPGGPSAMAYMSGMPGQQQQGQAPEQMPEVQNEDSAMQFLQWLMAQQEQGMF